MLTTYPTTAPPQQPPVSAAARRLISVVMPVCNEEEMLPVAYDEVTAVLSSLNYDYEVLLIDNASDDGTAALAGEICRTDTRWRYLRFSRNFGAEISLAAGLRYARGEAVITLFSDLQDPPERIPDLLAKWEEGYDQVYGVHTRRNGDPAWRNALIGLYYRFMHFCSEVHIPRNAGNFRLLSRRVVNVFNRMDERARYTRGILHWMGFKSCAVSYERRPRRAGRSKAPLLFMIPYALQAITSYSVYPLRAFQLLGGVALLVAILLAMGYLAAYLFWGAQVQGFTTTYLLLLANLGVMALGFGTLGEYISTIFIETKRRPLWLVDNTLNIEIPEEETMMFRTGSNPVVRNTMAAARSTAAAR
ncbi:MAG: putative glycosyltransferase [Phycisphaerae bacterium]|nr:putative glycosyltransferase [Phycisphaerae bacterium]